MTATTAEAPAALTARQHRIYKYLFCSTADNGFQPDIRTIMRALGLASPNGVVAHLRALEKKGYIDAGGGRSRAIRFLLRPDGQAFRGFVPL